MNMCVCVCVILRQMTHSSSSIMAKYAKLPLWFEVSLLNVSIRALDI